MNEEIKFKEVTNFPKVTCQTRWRWEMTIGLGPKPEV